VKKEREIQEIKEKAFITELVVSVLFSLGKCLTESPLMEHSKLVWKLSVNCHIPVRIPVELRSFLRQSLCLDKRSPLPTMQYHSCNE